MTHSTYWKKKTDIVLISHAVLPAVAKYLPILFSVICHLSVCLLLVLANTACKGLKSCSVRALIPPKVNMLSPKYIHSATTATTAAVTACKV